jgi:hypothetical protein
MSDIRDIQRRLAIAERAIVQRPIKSQSDTESVWSVQIKDGNTLLSGQAGIKRVSGTINEAFADTQANLEAGSGTLANGVGRGYLYRDGAQVFSGSSPRVVLVGNDARSGVSFALAAGEWIKVSAPLIKIGAYSGVNVYGYRPEFR